jgi:hypothetical protein
MIGTSVVTVGTYTYTSVGIEGEITFSSTIPVGVASMEGILIYSVNITNTIKKNSILNLFPFRTKKG